MKTDRLSCIFPVFLTMPWASLPPTPAFHLAQGIGVTQLCGHQRCDVLQSRGPRCCCSLARSIARTVLRRITYSYMLRASNRLSLDFRPVDALVKLLVHQPTHHHIVSTHQVQAVRLLA